MTYELVMNSLTIENCTLVKDKGMDAASNGLDPGGGGGGGGGIKGSWGGGGRGGG